MKNKIKVAILDDYQGVSLSMAIWERLREQIEVTVFRTPLGTEEEVAEKLHPFQIICVMRERTPLTRRILTWLPKLKLIISTGQRNASIDMETAEKIGITVRHTRYIDNGVPELTWGLLLALARNLRKETDNMLYGGWQTTIGTDLRGKTIGIIGLGRVGTKIAAYAKAFDMNILAWSENLTGGKVIAAGATLVSKETLLRESDFVTVHLVLSERTRGILTMEDLNLMKPTAYLINTSRGPLIKEEDLINILEQKKIAGAALDVFDKEPLPPDHPFRIMENVLVTPHLGYVTDDTYRVFYVDTVDIIQQWLEQTVEVTTTKTLCEVAIINN